MARKKRNPFLDPPKREELNRLLSPNELLQDVNYMYDNFLEVHPDLHFSISKHETSKMIRELAEKLTRPMTRLEFYPLVAPMAACFGDGHTMVSIPHEEYVLSDEAGSVRFPFRVAWRKNELVLTDTVLGEFSNLIGKSIETLNGETAETLLEDMLPMLSGESFHFRQSHLSDVFSKLLFVLRGGSNSYRLTFGNGTAPVEVPGLSRDASKELHSSRDDDSKPYSFELTGGRTGILTILRCEDAGHFKSFISSVFMKLAEAGTERLIIDLRNNGGGDSTIGDLLCAWLTDEPIRQFSGMRMKISRQIKRYYAFRHRNSTKFPLNLLPVSLLWPPLRKKPGHIFEMEVEKKPPPKRDPLFEDRLYVLISNFTFSAAASLAAMIKAHDLGTLVGEPTGGLTSCYGDIFNFSLPNSKLECCVSHKFIMGPEGGTSPSPTLPHISTTKLGMDIRNTDITRIIQLIDELN